ncbi:hypothetical protein PCC9214_01772 [Planktothrix tepida]|uniref:Uncharacterized protein n=1 Tax=Planktothrix tepida PCC 9214 TaxID=671072 RepID=A0A1J1LNV1_9CYAN|nr:MULTISPECIES: hypothetical protein [Planktothrix]CAD5938651.1 hypothetical protein PCC9214_01772 [Planktothrix tepida]CUR33265.1 hypothetical protein PL9214500512 [Planktothrix tepida PCC 9214]
MARLYTVNGQQFYLLWQKEICLNAVFTKDPVYFIIYLALIQN